MTPITPATKSPTQDPLQLALTTYCQLLGKSTRVDTITEGLPLKNGRLTIDLITRALGNQGINAVIVEKTLHQLENYHLPVLLLTQYNTGLVLVSKDDEHCTVVVPETSGQKTYTYSELEALISLQVVLADIVYKADNRAKDFAQPYKKHWLKEQLMKCWPTYIDVGIASLFANLLAVGTSLFALQVYDRVVPNDAFDTLFILTTGVVIAIIFDFILRVLRAYLLDVTGKKLDLELSSRLFSQILFMRLKAKPESTGAFSSQLKEFDSVREFFTSSTAASISDFPFIFLFLLLIWYLGGPVVWVPIIAILFMLLPSLLMQGKLAQLSREGMREGSVKQGLIIEVIENLETVKASHAESRNLFLWETLTKKQASDSVTFKSLSNRLSQGASMVQQLGFIFVVVVGVHQISASELTIGALIACTMLTSRTIAPVNQITGVLVRWQHVKVALEGLDQIMQSPTERPPERQFSHKPTLDGNYSIENVKLTYSESGPPALALNKLEFSSGSRTILLGGNGAGKSSLLRVLAGLEDIDSGQLLLDDIAMTQIDPADRQRDIGYLPQDSCLFYGTLRENLLLAGTSHTDDAIFNVLDNIGFGPAVRAHPLGLDMPILGSRSLSGGQRQAVALARLILQNPRIVLLDEPTSAFDQANEEKVTQFMQNWLQGKTLVMSTHKRRMLALGTRGVVLKQGKVTTEGNFDTIFAQQGQMKNEA
ncbi:MAG TPA: type I secretion system permease/ATPase [Oceanospirillales bacterium]|nr:type I secretion system permease/ATPase [Pseudoalteromonas marina]HCM04729.1 type I secretion system permease/ATPase [Oceanospirillales bacterium]|tara:strand:- start:2355 stop:4484 length:2130 start_codon:yes stop_codon:yes gene_type:complete